MSHALALQPKATLLFAGGGSGGHIYPGLAISEQLAVLSNHSVACVFICSDRPLDEKILYAAGAKFVRSPAKPIIARPSKLLAFVRAWPQSVSQTRALIHEHRTHAPVHLVAMGGFVAAPAVRAARLERCPATMVNLDAVPGKANRWIAPRVDRAFSAAAVPARFQPSCPGGWIEVPPIVRSAARSIVSQRDARTALGLDPSRPVLMITGGSQGLRSVNDFVTAFATSNQGRQSLSQGRWQVLHQTGRHAADTARLQYQSAQIDAHVAEFTDQMGLWWAAADLAICTAGAGNVAEIWASSTPALLLPYPHHRDQHQKFNAARLEQIGGVIVGVDHIKPAPNLASNGPTLTELLENQPTRAKMRSALTSLGPADGAKRIAGALLDALSIPVSVNLQNSALGPSPSPQPD